MSLIDIDTPGGKFRKYIPEDVIKCTNCNQYLTQMDKEYNLICNDNVLKVNCDCSGVFVFADFPRVFFRDKEKSFVIWKPFDRQQMSSPAHCSDVQYPPSSDKVAIFSFGQARVKVQGDVKTIKDIECDEIRGFNRKEAYIIPDYPLKAEFLDLIDADFEKVFSKSENITCQTGDNNYTWRLKLKGIKEELVVEKPVIKEEKGFEVSIWLWPDFVHNDWKLNAIKHRFGSKFDVSSGMGLIVNVFNNRFNKISNIKSDKRIVKWLKSNRLFFEIIIGNKSCGIYVDKREGLLDSSSKIDNLSFDLGTSNSASAYSLNGANNSIEFKDLTLDIFGTDFMKDFEIQIGDFLPTFGKSLAKTLPSELLEHSVTIPNDTSFNRLLSIPPAEISKDNLIILGGKIYENFKWDSPAGIPNGYLSTVYLKIFSLLVMAGLYRANNGKPVKIERLIFTIPAAYDFKKIEMFADNTGEVKNYIKDNCGVLSDKLEFINESYAAAHYYDLNPDKDYLILDLGGGTLDISLIDNKNGKKFKVIDSIKYAGRDLLYALCADNVYPVSNDFNPRLESTDSPEMRFFCISQLFRKGEIRKTFVLNNNSDDNRQKLLLLFLEGFLTFIRRLIAYHNADGRIQVALVGNGWKILSGIRGLSRTIEQELKEIISRPNTIAGFEVFTPALGSQVTHDFLYTSDTAKLIVSLGALKTQDSNFILNLNQMKSSNTGTPIKTILGFSMEIDGATVGYGLELPKNISDKDNSINYTVLNNSIAANFAKLNTSGMNEVDGIRKSIGNYIKSAGSEGGYNLEKSVFVQYLEESYKKKFPDGV